MDRVPLYFIYIQACHSNDPDVCILVW